MKVLHVTYDMRIGGTEMVIKSLIESSKNTEIEMSIFCIESPLGPWGQQLQEKSVIISQFSRRAGFDWHLIAALRSHIVKNQIDVVHCHQYTPWVYGALASLLTPAKVIFTEHGRFYPDFGTWKRKLINPVLSILTSNITSISSATKNALVKYENLKREKIDVVYNGIEPLDKLDEVKIAEFKCSIGLPSDCLILGTVARFDPIKNHSMMLSAFSSVLKTFPDLYLIIVGDGEERVNIEDKIKKLGIHQNVILTGYQSNPVQYMNIFDVFLLSSLSEGTSMTLLEAMSLGKPCVVTDAGGNAEVIEDGYNGFVTPNNNSEAFSNAIIKLLKSDSLIVMPGKAKHRFEEKFSVSKMVHAFRERYLKLGKRE